MTGPLVEGVIVSRNPATGEELARIPATPPDRVAGLVGRAREAQRAWADRLWSARRHSLGRWHAELARRAEVLADAVRAEVGKPQGEAMAAEVVPSLDALRWTLRSAGRVLAPRVGSPGSQRWLLMPPARVERRPIGVVGVIGAWNYPVLLNVPVIAHALAAGNAVVWKPSELSSHCGALIQETIDAAGLPDGLVSIVQGGPAVGSAMVESGVDKVVFTGGLENGRRVLAALGGRGVPAVAELSGFDAAVVLPDAPDAPTMAGLRWSAFLGAGQACMSVKRVFLVGRPAWPWAEAFGRLADGLRLGDPGRADVDVGPMISESARDGFHARVRSALDAGARLIAGGGPVEGPGWAYRPTVLLAEDGDGAPERALEGCFGPVVIVRGVRDDAEAASAVNSSRFGLSASVWGGDRRRARRLADRLDVGVVGINEATSFFALASAPAGGVKASGFGRVHGAEGLREMTAPRTIVSRAIRSPRPQVFPYSGRLERLLKVYRGMFH
ncbi:aldehyde dehydrogenase family protein [Tautonia plasticadhaerens]|uniref:Succinate-semialdehyde dehydrogenase [NADP(+)] 2 n=1 Tax=Tautonia plasticadhaerens TaxID=2527974 RepID=A0A518GZB8_9BACT|nr:aldehyde dehydrogenase family protein [Tautonia plasticadhaerens]QDV33947.1 Putative succinate-semialdehyde dehydrogenase [NADP(+)] 2 [Tautonia plasticadhaerens]